MNRQDPRIKGWITAKVSYLEMTAPPERPLLAAPGRMAVEIRRSKHPPLSFYRYLYNTIGDAWTWTGRRLMDDQTLAGIVHDPLVEINLLWVDGVPAGLCELDRRSPPDIELAYFGLIPDFIGKGLGSFFLGWAVDHVWRAKPRRFWVHTCDLDHPHALAVYQRAGFILYEQTTHREVILHDMPAPRRSGQEVTIDPPTQA